MNAPNRSTGPVKSKATYGDYDVDDDKDNLGDRSQDSQAPHLASSTTATDVCLHTIALIGVRNRTLARTLINENVSAQAWGRSYDHSMM